MSTPAAADDTRGELTGHGWRLLKDRAHEVHQLVGVAKRVTGCAELLELVEEQDERLPVVLADALEQPEGVLEVPPRIPPAETRVEGKLHAVTELSAESNRGGSTEGGGGRSTTLPEGSRRPARRRAIRPHFRDEHLREPFERGNGEEIGADDVLPPTSQLIRRGQADRGLALAAWTRHDLVHPLIQAEA
jgi:hypothetical protein